MKNRFKNIFAIFVWILLFSVTAVVGNVFLNYDTNEKTALAVGDEIEIATADRLENYINSYDTSRANATFVLTEDIDMTGKILKTGFGTATDPFAGTFDGRGHTISNLTFDFSTNAQGQEVVTDNKYVGLFGITNGATIKNFSIAGKTTFTVGKCNDAVYMSPVVGLANYTTITQIQNTSKISLNSADVFAKNVYFGAIAGMTSGGSISYVISRTSASDFGPWTLNDRNEKINQVGGIVGNLTNTQMYFVVGASKFNIIVDEDFYGTLDIGGVAGYVDQSFGSIIDVVLENTFTVGLPQLGTSGIVKVGQVVGEISNNAPESGNLSYIRYKSNTAGYSIFGDRGGYTYKVSPTDNIISIQNIPETTEEFNGDDYYFEYGPWDFETVWYLNAGTIYLQEFYGRFTVELGENLVSGNILELKRDFPTAYNYNDKVEIVFGFRSILDGESQVDLAKYYYLDALTLGGNVVEEILYSEGEYYLANTEKYTLTKSGENYVLTIKNVNRSTASLAYPYDIRTRAKRFNLKVTSKLYDGGTYVDEDTPPAQVYYSSGTPLDTLTDTITYDTKTVTINKRLRNANLPYAFVGWYLEKTGADVELTRAESLAINFGRGEYKDDISIYAKYEKYACVVTFKIDAGVQNIVLFGDEKNAITKTNTSVSVSKQEQNLKIEVKIQKDYDFDVKEFIAGLDTYKSTGESFCTWLNENDPTRPANYYMFNLDMTVLNYDDFGDRLNISIQTTENKASSKKMKWIIVGSSVGGGVLIAGLVVVIIIIKRRNGGGFGGGFSSGKTSFKKGSYKDMYY